jgi:hypothetical protein
VEGRAVASSWPPASCARKAGETAKQPHDMQPAGRKITVERTKSTRALVMGMMRAVMAVMAMMKMMMMFACKLHRRPSRKFEIVVAIENSKNENRKQQQTPTVQVVVLVGNARECSWRGSPTRRTSRDSVKGAVELHLGGKMQCGAGCNMVRVACRAEASTSKQTSKQVSATHSTRARFAAGRPVGWCAVRSTRPDPAARRRRARGHSARQARQAFNSYDRAAPKRDGAL